MPLSFSPLFAWLERQREKLVDAALLFLALTLPSVFAVHAPTPWLAQATMLAIFAALASPRAHQIPTLWHRYLRLLPGYVAAAVTGAIVFIYWFNLSRSHAWFAPLWLVLTTLARLPVSAPARKTAAFIRNRRLDVICADFAWLAGFSYGVPRWTGHAGPAPLALAALGVAWVAWHCVLGGCDPAQGRPYRHGYWKVIGLALAWGVLWASGAGAWPAVIYSGWLALALVLTRALAQRLAASADTGPGEVMRWIGLFAITSFLFHTFASPLARGAGDSNYYATFLADTLTQFQHGIFPVYVGQSEYQFNGAVIPIRVAPGFQYLGGLLDLLTGRTLGTIAVQNLLITITALAAAGSAYACLRRTTSSAPVAWMLALLYLTCPGVIGLAFNSDLYMSWMTVPWVPVIFYLSCRSFVPGSTWVYASLGFALGFTWWLHAPIALWLTLAATVLQLARLIWLRPPWRMLPMQLAGGAAAFLGTALYPLVSATLYPADPAVGTGGGFVVAANQILQRLLDTFPAAWLPVSDFGRELSDFQIGYGLLLIGALAVPFAWRTRRIELRVLMFMVGALLLLLIPIPKLNLALWQLVPAAIRLVTNNWIMQRLYVVLAGCLVFLAGAAWAAARPSARVRWVLVATCFWSATEAMKFIRGSWASINPHDVAPLHVLPENITLTRYSYGLFGPMPAYFTHGVTDPVLENRFLAEDLRTVTGGNQETAIRQARTGVKSEHAFYLNTGRLIIQRPLPLQPGKRYLAELVTSADPFPAATLLLRGDTVERIYGLPQYGEALSFGLGDKHPPFIALHTSGTREENVGVQLITSDSAAMPGLEGRVSLRLSEYDPARLPVQIRSWLPYTANVQTEGPAWLETPRMYQAGYRAWVNGRPVEVRRSAQGLASLPVPTGRAEVVLRYVAPAGLGFAFWLSFAAIAAAATTGLCAALRRLTERAAAPATPAAGGR